MTIPTGKTQSGDIEQCVRWRRVSAPDVPVVGREAKAIHVQQPGKTRLKALKLLTILARNHLSQGFIPAHKPMVQASHDVRHTPSVSINTSRAEWGDKLANADLLASHD
jgi:hypothetical protein